MSTDFEVRFSCVFSLSLSLCTPLPSGFRCLAACLPTCLPEFYMTAMNLRNLKTIFMMAV